MGDLVLGLELVPEAVVLLLLLLLQAARTPADRTATALSARPFLESRERGGLTPGASFLVRGSHGLVSLPVPSPSETSACSLTSTRPAESACCCSRAAKSESPYPRPTRPWISWWTTAATGIGTSCSRAAARPRSKSLRSSVAVNVGSKSRCT